jgi:hypothetical protein
MVNWQKFKIKTASPQCSSNGPSMLFGLGTDRFVDYNNGKYWFICCVDSLPFNTWEVGDYLEIDTDKTRNYEALHNFDDTSIVRKVSSNEIVSRNSNIPSITRNQTLAIGRELDALIDQSGGRNEYEAKIHVDPDNKVNGYSIVGRRSK